MVADSLKLSTERLKKQLDKLEDKFETELSKLKRWRKKLQSNPTIRRKKRRKKR